MQLLSAVGVSLLLVTPKAGVKTPGIQIPISNLKPESEIALPAKPGSMVAAKSAIVATEGGLTLVDTKTNKTFPKPCGGIVSAFGSLWVPSCGDGSLLRIDSKGEKVTATVATGVAGGVSVITATADSVWLLSDAKATLTRIDPENNTVVAETRLPAGCNAILSAESALWATCPAENVVLRIDALTNVVGKRIEVAKGPRALASGEGAIWVLCDTEGKVAKIDPKTDKVTATIELSVPNGGGNIAVGEKSVWVSQAGFPLTRIDPQTDKVAQQFVGSGGGAIYAGAAAIWLLNSNENTAWRLDPKRIKATLAE